MKYRDHIRKCLKKVEDGYCKLNDQALSLEGMVQKKGRTILNTICEMENCRYLQIGCWRGATLYSALYKNNLEYAFVCDDFSEFSFNTTMNTPERKRILDLDIMLDLIQPDDDDNVLEFDFYDSDCFYMDLNHIKKPINVYYYDGGHDETDHYLALKHFYPVLDKDFIFICDDWAEERVQYGTHKAMRELALRASSWTTSNNFYIASVQKILQPTGVLIDDQSQPLFEIYQQGEYDRKPYSIKSSKQEIKKESYE